MKICFVLPQMLKKPIGGYKMVYEYANRLSLKGHEIGILFINDSALSRLKMPRWIWKIAVEIFTYSEPKWFVLNKKIRKYSSTKTNIKKVLQKYELAIATGVDTVEKTQYFFPDSRKAYFIQGYENWVYSEDKVNRTFSLGMDNIVVAGWLKKIVDQYAKKPSLLLKNPIDTSVYTVKKTIESRNRHSIGVLYHTAENKGFQYAYKTILELKKKYPDLKVQMFGTAQPTFEIPRWIEFTLNATQEQTVEIYNSVAIFMCATVCEGYGLTGLEAMACGAALVSTEYDGVKEYAIHGENALLSPIKEVEALKINAEKLMDDSNFRYKIALNGVERAKEFSWEKAINVLNNYIIKIEDKECENDRA